MVCDNWGTTEELGVEKELMWNKPVELAWNQLEKAEMSRTFLVKYFFIPSLILPHCCVMWNSFYLSAVDSAGDKESVHKTSAVLTTGQHLWDMWWPHEEKWDYKGMSLWWASGHGGGGSCSEGVLSSSKLRESWGMDRRKSRWRAGLFQISVSTKLIVLLAQQMFRTGTGVVKWCLVMSSDQEAWWRCRCSYTKSCIY